MSERGTFTVPKNSWHGRVYRFWLEHASAKTPDKGYRENLCHYVRVVLIWSAMHLLVNFPARSKVKMWHVVFGLGIAGALGLTFILWPKTALGVLVYLVTFGLALGAMIGLAYLGDKHEDKVKQLYWDDRERHDKIMARRDKAKTWTAITFIAIGGVAALGGILYLAINYTARFFTVVGMIIGASLLAAIVVLGVGALVSRFQRRRAHKVGPEVVDNRVPPEKKGDPTWRLVYDFFRAKKHKVCPLIDFEGGSPHGEPGETGITC